MTGGFLHTAILKAWFQVHIAIDPTFESHAKAPMIFQYEGTAPSALLLTALSHLDAGPDGQEERMKAPAPPTPEMVDVQRLDP